MASQAGSKLRASDLGLIAAKYQRTTQQTGINTGTNTIIAWNVQAYNVGSAVNESSGVLTLNKTGLWRIDGMVQMEGFTSTIAAPKSTYAWLGDGVLTNAAHRYCGENTGLRDGIDSFSFGTDWSFAAGDTLALWVWHDKGSASATLVSEFYTTITVRYLGPLI
jgi:hypothetical protein